MDVRLVSYAARRDLSTFAFDPWLTFALALAGLCAYAILGAARGLLRAVRERYFGTRIVCIPILTACGGVPLLLDKDATLSAPFHADPRYELLIRAAVLILPFVGIAACGTLGMYGRQIDPGARARGGGVVIRLGGWLLLGALVQEASAIMWAWAQWPVSVHRSDIPTLESWLGAPGIFALLVMPAFAEEAFFRGFLLGAKKQTRRHEVAAQLGVALIWVSLHGYSIPGSGWLVAVGLLLGAIRRGFGLGASIAVHLGYNLDLVPSLFSGEL